MFPPSTVHGLLVRFLTKKNILITDLYYFYPPDRCTEMLLYRRFSQKQLFHELNIDFNIKQITLSARAYMPQGTYCTILFMGHTNYEFLYLIELSMFVACWAAEPCCFNG